MLADIGGTSEPLSNGCWWPWVHVQDFTGPVTTRSFPGVPNGQGEEGKGCLAAPLASDRSPICIPRALRSPVDDGDEEWPSGCGLQGCGVHGASLRLLRCTDCGNPSGYGGTVSFPACSASALVRPFPSGHMCLHTYRESILPVKQEHVLCDIRTLTAWLPKCFCSVCWDPDRVRKLKALATRSEQLWDKR